MYQPTHFQQTDPEQLTALMQAHPLATLVRVQDGVLTADHVPMIYEPDTGAGTLRGHIARANPLWRHGGPVMAVFQGVQAYVSPSWYPSKAATHKVVPTWNYQVVHAHGTLRAVEDRDWLHALVSRLTGRHEGGRTVPWGVDDAPADFVEQLLRAIVGIEISVMRLEGKWKLSQNRSAEDRAGTADGLAAEPDADARAMAGLIRPA